MCVCVCVCVCVCLSYKVSVYHIIFIGFADSMSVWNLLREFRIRKVHMAVVLNEYGGTVGVCTHTHL